MPILLRGDNVLGVMTIKFGDTETEQQLDEHGVAKDVPLELAEFIQVQSFLLSCA